MGRPVKVALRPAPAVARLGQNGLPRCNGGERSFYALLADSAPRFAKREHGHGKGIGFTDDRRVVHDLKPESASCEV